MEHNRCARVLEVLLALGEAGRAPWHRHAANTRADAAPASGTLDFTIDEAHFPAFLEAVFDACQDAGISFVLAQPATGIRRIILRDCGCGGAVTLVLWPRTRPATGHARAPRGLARARRGWCAPGTTAVVGPDGSGKTAVLDGLAALAAGRSPRIKRFKRYFRRVLPHVRRAEDRNTREERTLWLILPVAWLTFSLSRWLTGRARPLVLDRYFYDYFVRDARSTTRPARRIGAYTLCSALTPRPQRLIIISCPADTIRARKAELPADAIHALYQVYLDQVVRAHVPLTLFCHTGIALADSVRDAAWFLELGHPKSQ